jgi:hypothetical protein
MAPFSTEWWLFVNTFAEWFSAIGTIAAVIVALRLARRDARITLRISVGVRRLAQLGASEHPEYFWFEVTNVGRRSARITNLIMRDGFPFRSAMVMIPPQNALSSTVPTTINDGERATYMIRWEEYEEINGDRLAKHFSGRLGRLRARRFRIGVSTSAGGEFFARIENGLAKRFVEIAKREGEA